MKALKVSEVIKMLLADGWYLYTIKGDHRQFKHPIKIGKVTVSGKLSLALDQFLLNSIFLNKLGGDKNLLKKLKENGKNKSSNCMEQKLRRNRRFITWMRGSR